MTDFDLFHPDRMACRILDMGDMLTLIEQAEKTFDQDRRSRPPRSSPARAATSPSTTSCEQMQQVRKLGSMSKIMGMLPGMGQFRDQLADFDEREIDRIQAIIQSMTPAERANPKLIDGSRRARIAKGSGRTGQRREHARRPVLRGPQDDDVLRPRRRHARVAGDARHGGRRRQAQQGEAEAGQGPVGSPATPPRRPPRRRPRRRRPPAPVPPPPTPSATRTATRSTTRRPPPRLDLPKDFSKYLS